MALLLNRKYGSRLECLYYILKSRYEKFGTSNKFKLKDLKYDETDCNNVQNYCKLLQNIIDRKCCPFLENKLDSSKCYATGSVVRDSTKSKAASDICGSLEALGFIQRHHGNNYSITENGKQWVNSDFNSQEWENIALQGVLSYGVMIGLLYKFASLPDTFSYSGVYISYPQTYEVVRYTSDGNEDMIISISTDSQRDSNTRTMTRLLNWCVTVGLLEPVGVSGGDSKIAHLKYRDFINAEELTIRNFKKTKILKSLFANKIYVANPLAYKRLHKNVASLRENGGEDLRTATLKYNDNILNRRFVFVYALNHFSKKDLPLNFKLLIETMNVYKDKFVTEMNDLADIMETEREIAYIAGIPFIENDNAMLYAQTTINEDVLTEEIPNDILDIAKKIVKDIEESK